MRIYEFNEFDSELAPGEKMDFLSTNASANDKLILLIEKHCSDALQAMRQAHKPLYRGFRGSHGYAFIGAPRKARRTFTNKGVVDLFNEHFKRSGIKANRSNSISTTSAAGAANTFGDLYYIFPVNGFSFSWSPMVNDFGSIFGGYNLEEFHNAYPGEGSLVDEFNYTDRYFDAALKSGNEINILGRYVAVEAERPIFGQENITLTHKLGIN
jgi:hypothetical protein